MMKAESRFSQNISCHRRCGVLQKQKGASALTVLVGLFILSILFTVAVKLIPIYMDHMTINSVMQSIFDDDNVGSWSDNELLRNFDSRLSINNIRNFDSKKVKITRDRGLISADISYEVRTNVFKNVDAVVVFSDQYQAKARD